MLSLDWQPGERKVLSNVLQSPVLYEIILTFIPNTVLILGARRGITLEKVSYPKLSQSS